MSPVTRVGVPSPVAWAGGDLDDGGWVVDQALVDVQYSVADADGHLVAGVGVADPDGEGDALCRVGVQQVAPAGDDVGDGPVGGGEGGGVSVEDQAGVDDPVQLERPGHVDRIRGCWRRR
jgi:hypothetical protein